MFKFTKQGYVFHNESTRPRVIYRWRVCRKKWTIADLNKLDYYSCPSLVPVKGIFRLSFQPCDTVDECIKSLENYRKAIDWGRTLILTLSRASVLCS